MIPWLVALSLVQSPNEDLLRAAQLSSPEAVRVAIKSGADPNAKDKMGCPAITLAVRHNRDESVRALLRFGANPNIRDADGRTPIFWCSYWPRDDIRDKEPEQLRALIAEYLISFKANVNLADSEGVTPLMQAAARRHDVVLDVLLRARASTTITDMAGRNALTWASHLGKNDPIVLRLLKAGLKPGVFETLAFGNKWLAYKQIERGDDVKVRGPRNDTVLMRAAALASPMCIKALLERGVSLNEQDAGGWTALMYAVVGQPSASELSGSRLFPSAKPEDVRLTSVRELVKAGAKAALKSHLGETALSLALECKQTRIAEFLGTMTNS